MGRPAETSLLTVLGAGENGVLDILRFILDPILVIVRDVGQSKDVGNTLGVIPHAPIPKEVTKLINWDGASVAAKM